MSCIAGLRCTVCRSSALDFSPDAISCRECGHACPVLGGVPVMFEQVSVQSGEPADDASVRQVLSAFGLPDDPIAMLRLRTIMRRQARFGSGLIQIESRQFLDRLRSTGHDIEAAHRAGSPVAEAPAAMDDLATVPRYAWSKSYMPRRIGAGTEFLANMRLENRGTAGLRKAGHGRAMAALRWRDRDGAPVEAKDPRTPLPIDLAPGQSVTLAVRVAAPMRPGAYLLDVTLVQEQVRWLDEDALHIAVTVEPIVPGPVPDGWQMLPDAPADYDADHVHGRAMLAEWLAAHAPGRPRVLEIGGNAVPMIAGLEGELFNVDVDLLGLQVGHMLTLRHDRPVRQICADAFDLPFASGYFDAIVIFASLHHFPDPAALLQRLAPKLRPGGFIGLFCEPVGHIWPGAITPDFLAELEKGVNEQSFSLREYELMFRQAELKAMEVLVDWNSLKARLMHAGAEGQP